MATNGHDKRSRFQRAYITAFHLADKWSKQLTSHTIGEWSMKPQLNHKLNKKTNGPLENLRPRNWILISPCSFSVSGRSKMTYDWPSSIFPSCQHM